LKKLKLYNQNQLRNSKKMNYSKTVSKMLIFYVKNQAFAREGIKAFPRHFIPDVFF
jgi:hypothetical protein